MSLVKLATLLLIITSALLGRVENTSIFGIGTRILGDQLLVKDVLKAPPWPMSHSPMIRFNYAIPEPITYIEILSEENVLAEVAFSYTNDLVEGAITGINHTITGTRSRADSDTDTDYETETEVASTESNRFEVLISIYGFNDTVMNLNYAYVLNRDQNFHGILEPQQNDEEYLNLNESDEALNGFGDTHADDEDFGHGDKDDDDDDEDDYEHMDNIIELGRRQNGDYKIYETFQTSLTTTQEPTNHTVVFYYVDSSYITYAKFVIYDHYVDKSALDQNTPIAEYSHISPTTLKAIITDHQTTTLFVQMFLYGYKPEDLPVDYEPYLPISHRGPIGTIGSTASPMSPLQRLKMLMNAQNRAATDAMPTATTSEDNNGDDDDNDEDDDDGHDDANDAGGKNTNGLLCSSGALSMSSNLLIATPLPGCFGAVGLCIALVVSLFSAISSFNLH